MRRVERDQGYFVGTPFALTATLEIAACWAGRRTVKEKLERLCRSYITRPDSSLDLIWSNLGAGKSHALLHLIYLLDGSGADRSVSAFVEMPEQCKRFIDLYRRIIAELPLGKVVPRLLSREAEGASEDLKRAARTLAHGGSEQKELAREWLSAGRPQLRDLRNATGIGTRIESDVHACEVLSEIAGVLARQGVRTVILLDEFQRVAASLQKQREAILANLRSVFSRNPAYFSVVLAVTSRIEKSAVELLPQELRTLMGMRPTVSLPEMNQEEALEFLLERFRFFRPPGYSGLDAAPFGEEALRALVSHVASAGTERVIPRTLLQAAAWLYDEAVARGSAELPRVVVDRLLQELKWDV